MGRDKVYGIADKAWQCVIGCSPSMPCSKRCWARRTVARIVECQKGINCAVDGTFTPCRATFFREALSPDLKQWSGRVLLDERHLYDPLRWKKPAVIATGFHGDWARLNDADRDQILCVMARAKQHTFLPLSKEPQRLAHWLWMKNGHFAYEYEHSPACSISTLLPLDNVNLGCSVMNQSEADKHLPHMRALAAMGWQTHIWYEPAIGPVNWTGWEFLKLIICGGESGAGARPMRPDWARSTRDWCLKNGAGFILKQWGQWAPVADTGFGDFPGAPEYTFSNGDGTGVGMISIGKKAAGCLLDGKEWKQMPEVKA